MGFPNKKLTKLSGFFFLQNKLSGAGTVNQHKMTKEWQREETKQRDTGVSKLNCVICFFFNVNLT